MVAEAAAEAVVVGAAVAEARDAVARECDGAWYTTIMAEHGTSSSKPTVLVTGATGVVGSALVAALLQRGVTFRVFVRDASKLAHLPEHVERALGDLHEPAAVRAAMCGIERVFLLSPEIAPAQFASIVAAARAEGVRHIVKLSVLEAGYGSDGIARWHRAEEQEIEASGLAWTFIRPGNFASNALSWRHSISREGKVYAPTADAQSAPIDPRDIADVIALALTEPVQHAGKAYMLTGPELLTVADQATVLTRVLNKPVVFQDIDPHALGAQLRGFGVQPAMVDALVELWFAIRTAGVEPVITDTVTQLLGRPARRFQTWVQDHAESFAV